MTLGFDRPWRVGLKQLFVLRFADVKRHAAHVTLLHVIRPDRQVGGHITIGCAVVAAATSKVSGLEKLFFCAAVNQLFAQRFHRPCHKTVTLRQCGAADDFTGIPPPIVRHSRGQGQQKRPLKRGLSQLVREMTQNLRCASKPKSNLRPGPGSKKRLLPSLTITEPACF